MNDGRLGFSFSLEESLKRDARIQARGGRDQVPTLALTLTPRGRRAAPYKAMNRYTSELARAKFREAHSGRKRRKEVNLSDDFSRAAEGDSDSGHGGDTTEALRPSLKKGIRRSRNAKPEKSRRDKDRGR